MSGATQYNFNKAMSMGFNEPIPPFLQQSKHPIQPRPMDVLCGKSKQCVDHGGSRRFRGVIECYREQYQQALTKWDKTSVTRTIYDHLSQAGSRFLKYDDKFKIWEEVSPMAARDKIGHALRFANRVTRRKRGPSCIGVRQSVPVINETSSGIQQMNGLGIDATVAPSQLLVHVQTAPLGCASSPSPAAHQLLQAQQHQSVTSTPTLIPIPSVLESQGLINASILPLARPNGWLQCTESVNLKCTSKTESASADDSLSLLDGILPFNQIAENPKQCNDLPFVDLDFDNEILSVLF